MIYYGKGRLQYALSSNPFAAGGEGKLYNITGQPNLVAKIYKDGKASKEKEQKLVRMINFPLDKNILSQIAWPQDVLYNAGQFIGFTMPKMNLKEDLNVIYEYGSSAKYPNMTWENKIIIAQNICAVLSSIHDSGYVCGDLNPKNISIDPQTGFVVFLDTDSYHVSDGVKTYRCDVGIPEYLPVEIQKKMRGGYTLATTTLPTFSQDTDNFALAIHIFQLLMNGAHPFACAILPSHSSVTAPQPSDNIEKGEFPFMQNRSGIRIPVYAPKITILPKEMQDLFKRAFIDGHTSPNVRPKPEEWHSALDELKQNLIGCKKVAYHQYNGSLSSCPWCEVTESYNKTFNKVPLAQIPIKQISFKPSVSMPTKPMATRQVQVSLSKIKNWWQRLPMSTKKVVVFIVLFSVIIIILAQPSTVTNIDSTKDNAGSSSANKILLPPSNVNVTGIGSDNVELWWNDVGSWYSYKVYYHTQNDPNAANVKSMPATKNSIKVLNLESNTNYYFWVTTVQGYQESAKSSLLKVTTIPSFAIIGMDFANTLNGNVIGSYGTSFNATDIKSISPRIIYVGFPDNKILNVKIIKPDGSLSTNNYTLKVQYGEKEKKRLLSGWVMGSSYKSGDYTCEIWSDGKKLYSAKFTVVADLPKQKAPVSISNSPLAKPTEQTLQQREREKSVTQSSFTDARDGTIYKTVKIGNQVWMAENLNYNASGSKCYNNKESNCTKYGRLYNWETAMKACPSGWHLPSNKEWQTLVDFVGGENAGKKLKAKNGWDNGTDDFGFSALSGGAGNSDGNFFNAAYRGNWWSASEHSTYTAHYRSMSNDSDYYQRDNSGKSSLFSVRCLQDTRK